MKATCEVCKRIKRCVELRYGIYKSVYKFFVCLHCVGEAIRREKLARKAVEH